LSWRRCGSAEPPDALNSELKLEIANLRDPMRIGRDRAEAAGSDTAFADAVREYEARADAGGRSAVQSTQPRTVVNGRQITARE